MISLISLKRKTGKGPSAALVLALAIMFAALPAGRLMAQGDPAGGEAKPREGAKPEAPEGAKESPKTPTPAEGKAAPTGKLKKQKFQVKIPTQDRQYREMTPPDRQEQARKIFHVANDRFEQRRVDEALKLYRKAYGLWPHPRILFNIAVSLGFLSQPLQSAKVFKEVLRYGPEPINPERYKQASDRYLELMGQLTMLVVVCDEVGAKLFVDGKPIGTGPLNTKVTLGPGTHMVTATLKGKVPYSAQVRLEPGTRAKLRVSMQAFTDVLQYKMVSRYHWAVPAAVTAVAGILLATGTGLLITGRGEVSDLQGEVNQTIATYGATVPFGYNTSVEDRAVTMQITGQALMGVAAGTAVAATVLWLIRKKRVRDTGAGKPSAKGGKVEIRF